MNDFWGEIKDPIYGYVYVTKAEKKIIDSFPFQRLRRIRQLAGSEYVYPGATHTRFEHSIGVMYLTNRLVKNPYFQKIFSEEDSQTLRFAAMLHDVGHGPFSHIFEEILIKYFGKNHEDFTKWVILQSELRDIISDLGYNPKKISELAIGILNHKEKNYLNQIIKSSVDVDKLDFLIRDTYHSGAKFGFIDVFRIIDTFEVINGYLCTNISALSALEAFVLARIESFKSIYFHRVGRAVQLMLAMAMDKAANDLRLNIFNSIDEYLALDDYTLWVKLKECEKSKKIMNNLEKRKLIKCVYDSTVFFIKEKSFRMFDDKTRDRLKNEIAEKSNIEPEKIIIDISSLPSVPYHSVYVEKIMDIPIFFRNRYKEKVNSKLSKVSGIFKIFKSYMNIIRVYTEEPNNKIIKACEEILGKISYSKGL